MHQITNPSRRRYYGLDVNDRVKRTIGFTGPTLIGKVVELVPMDNNRVRVLWEGKSEPTKEVAEWCTLIDDEGLEINNIIWRMMQNFDGIRRVMSSERMKFVLVDLNITEEQVIKIFNNYPGININKIGDNWYLIAE